jgi:biotin carboxyl carrier protein
VEYKIEKMNQFISGTLITSQQNGTVIVSINGNERSLKIIRVDGSELEFMLDNKFYNVKIIESLSSHVRLDINGQQVSLKKHSKLADILGKSLSRSEKGPGENRLSSQIPGRVVAIMVKVGVEIKKGDSIAILESMKMQIAVKAHKDGTIREIKVREGSTVARYDVIAIIE